MTRFMSRMLWALPLTLGLVFAGCAEDDDRPPTFEYIHQAIIKPNCTTSDCHSTLAAVAGINLEKMEGAYHVLVGRACGQEVPGQAPRNFVTPFVPETSKLMYQLRGEQTRRMPPDLALPPVDVDLVERWILDGAPCR